MTNQEAGEPMTPNPRAEWEVRASAFDHCDVVIRKGATTGGFTVWQGVGPRLCDALNEADRAEALAGLAKEMRTCVDIRQHDPTTMVTEVNGELLRKCCAEYDRLTASESGEKPS